MEKILFVLITVCILCAQERREFIKQQVVEHNKFIHDGETRAYKFSKMATSPFTFFRATAHLYYKDIELENIKIPYEWVVTANVNTWIQGDSHIQNIGFFDVDGEICWDVNDFDESYIAPFYWDVIRYMASVYLICDEIPAVQENDIDILVGDFAAEYQKYLEKVTEDNHEVFTLWTEKNTSGEILKKIGKLKKKKSNGTLLDKWTTLGTFDFDNEKLRRLTTNEQQVLHEIWEQYLKHHPKNKHHFTVKDRAVRLKSGLGSLGVRKYYLLVDGVTKNNNDDLIFEIKEQQLPTMLKSALADDVVNYYTLFASHGQRSYTAQQALHNKSQDSHTYYVSIGNISYSIVKMSPWESNFDSDNIDDLDELRDVVLSSAKILAYAHSRGDDDFASYCNYSFEKNAVDAIRKWPKTKTTLAQLAKDYAIQTVKDHEMFVDLVKQGEIK